MMAIKFTKYLKYGRSWRSFRREKGDKEEPNNQDDIICCKCKKPGNVKFDILNVKKGQSLRKRKRRLLGDNEEDYAIFLSDDDGDSKLEQLANLYMMANMESPKKRFS